MMDPFNAMDTDKLRMIAFCRNIYYDVSVLSLTPIDEGLILAVYQMSPSRNDAFNRERWTISLKIELK